MRIAFVGKGGSGKTTISSLLARHIAAKGLPIIAIDADINQHLATSLGMRDEEAKNLPAMGSDVNSIKEYLRGTNTRISSCSTMIKTTPPGSGSRLIHIQENNPIYDRFEKNVGGVRLLAVGPFDEEDLGTKCYHSKTGSVELILNHLIDKEKEYVVVDMTAGSDSFASGMFTKFDVTFLVVEPTLKSLSVYEQYKKYAENYDVKIRVIANKVENATDFDFIKEKVGHELVAVFAKSNYVRSMERGQFLSLHDLETENKKSLDHVIEVVDKCTKDWNKFYEQTSYFHIQNAKSWANVAVGEDVSLQIDPEFTLRGA